VSTITPQIVLINLTVQAAPQSSNVQQSGVLISVGGTTLTTGTTTYLSKASDLASHLSALGNYVELGYMNSTFFAQGNDAGCYVLELGVVANPAAGVAALTAWMLANATPQQAYYVYCVPALWGTTAAANMATLAGTYSSPESKTYFCITTSQADLTDYGTPPVKAALTIVPAAGEGATVFDAAALMYNIVVNQPSSVSPLSGLAYRYLYGVTPWTQPGNGTVIDEILTAYGNVILTGAEGGISTSLLRNGTTMDGFQFGWWYGADWFQFATDLNIAAAIINGANTGKPIAYSQTGINQLLGIVNSTAATAISNQLLSAADPATAVSFADWTAANPSAYQDGTYGGLQIVIYPANQFLQIVVNITASQLAT
jgi:hypothetical protein